MNKTFSSHTAQEAEQRAVPERGTWQRNLAFLWIGELIAIAGFSVTLPFMPYYVQELGIMGVDQVAFIQQGGKNKHEHICEALELFAAEVKPEFSEFEAEREKKKAEELAPYIEKAMARKKFMKELADEEIPNVIALGRQITDQGSGAVQEEPERRSGSGISIVREDPSHAAE